MSIKERILKYIAGFTYLVLGVVILFGVLLGVFIYMMPECHDKEALSRAKEVPVENWPAIYNEAEILLGDSSRHYYELESLPKNIAALNPVNVVSQGQSLWLYLAACGFDDKVIVVVNTSEKYGQKIHVQWGDPAQSLVLWQKPNKSINYAPAAPDAQKARAGY